MVLLGVVPCLDQTIANRVASGLVGAEIVEVESRPSERVLNMVYDGALN